MEIDLLANYPKTKRDLKARLDSKSPTDQAIAREFGKDFFDGDRRHGYGGFNYNARFWQPVIPDFQRYFGLREGSRLLDVGCAKGFMLCDLIKLVPGIEVAGVDVSSYAIDNCVDQVRPFLQVADARSLPFADRSFDVVISINTIHNLEIADLEVALREIQRVSRGRSFVTVDAYRNDDEKVAMYAWNLTAKTILHVDEWKELFARVGYTGDYYWFMP